MGYCYTNSAAETLEHISANYSAQDGSSNTILVNGQWGFFETSTRTQKDGGICGNVQRRVTVQEREYWKSRGHDVSENAVVKAGTFKIAGTGKIIRFAGLPVAEINKSLGYN